MNLLHKRRFRTLLGPQGFNAKHFLLGLGIIAVFGAMTSLLAIPFFPVARNLDFASWLSILPLALILIFFQSGAEELVFRGYLQQQLAARFHSPIFWMILPSVLFGLGHASTEFGSNNVLMVATLIVSGLIAADVTRRTGMLSLAIGLHVGNNILAILILGYDTPEGTASLWVDPTPMSDVATIRANLLITALSMVATYVAALLIAGRISRQV